MPFRLDLKLLLRFEQLAAPRQADAGGLLNWSIYLVHVQSDLWEPDVLVQVLIRSGARFGSGLASPLASFRSDETLGLCATPKLLSLLHTLVPCRPIRDTEPWKVFWGTARVRVPRFWLHCAPVLLHWADGMLNFQAPVTTWDVSTLLRSFPFDF